MNLDQYDYSLEFTVRDYECDMDGVVNNAQYLHYLEHTRNICMKSIGLSYRTMTERKDHIFIARINMDIKYPLKADDHFVVVLKVRRTSSAKMQIDQEIFRIPDERIILTAEITALGMRADGTYRLPEQVIEAFPMVNCSGQE
jgi:acyl-CoA thioester hydrolase